MENIYQAPQAQLLEPRETDDGAFYVVSRNKFLVLFFVTVGMYSLYWFYKNWALQRNRTGESIMPVWRSIFVIFFTHSLFARVKQCLVDKNIDFAWHETLAATAYVIVIISSSILDRLAYSYIGSPITDILSILLVGVEGYILYRAQLAVNVAAGDEAGVTNSTFTPANYLWCALGVAMWVIIGVGYYAMFFEDAGLYY